MNFVPLTTSLEPDGIIYLFDPYLTKLTEDAMGDQAKGFARTMVNNIHCSPFVCTDPPPVLECSQVGWVQSNLSKTVLALPSDLLVLQVPRNGFLEDWLCCDLGYGD